MAVRPWYNKPIEMNDYSPGFSRNADPYLKKLRRRRIVVGTLAGAVIAAVVAAGIVGLTRIAAGRSAPKATQQTVVDLWSAKDYPAVSAACDASLELEPLDPFYLVFKGFSAFYLGLAETDGEQRMLRMDEAVFSIRKALIDKNAPLRPEASYVLGKAYFHKGVDYYNEAIEYLSASSDLGYYQADTWEYLALAEQGLGKIQESVAYFNKAIESKPGSPELILAAAMANMSAGDNARAEALAMEALSSTSDEYLAERCGFLLGDIFRSTGRLEEALARYAAIKDKNPESADAWYYEGLVLSETGDPIKARAAWRKAISIDPMHAGARLKLSERS